VRWEDSEGADERARGVGGPAIAALGSVLELAGSVQGAGLPQLIQVLGDLGKSGCLRLSEGNWTGEVAFDRGEVVGAAFGQERGLPALEAIVFALPHARFAFSEGATTTARDIRMPRGELDERLAATVAARANLPHSIATPADVPRLAAPDEPGRPEAIRLDRSTARTMLAVDGRRSIHEIAGERALAQTVRELVVLARAGLICVDPPPTAPATAPSVTGRSPGLGRTVRGFFIRDPPPLQIPELLAVAPGLSGLATHVRQNGHVSHGLATAPSARTRTVAGMPWPFATFLAGLGISALGDTLYALALPWFAYELTGSPLVMGSLYAAETLPVLLFGSLVGVYVDRWDRRRLLLGADLLRAGIVASIPALYLLGHLQIGYLYVAAFALALMTLGFDVGTTAVVPELAGEELTRANAAQQFVTQAASLSGPAVAGVVIATFGALATLWLDAVSFAGTFLVVLILPSFKIVADHAGSASSVFKGMVEGLRWLWGNRVIRILSLQASIGNFGFGMVMAVFLYYLRATLGLSAELSGLDYAMLELGGLLGTLAIVPLEQRVRRGTLYTGIILWGMLGLTMTASLRSWWWGPGVGMAVLLSCNFAWIIITTSVRQELIPADLRGRVLSFSRVLSSASMPLGALLGGLLMQRYDPLVVFTVAIATKGVELAITRWSSMRTL
jgi:MFS family permease